jgi:hypothetical protein
MKKPTLILRKQTLVQLSALRLAHVQGGIVLDGPPQPRQDPRSWDCASRFC